MVIGGHLGLWVMRDYDQSVQQVTFMGLEGVWVMKESMKRCNNNIIDIIIKYKKITTTDTNTKQNALTHWGQRKQEST
jgi:predicted hydrolase (HD superfamily)